MADNTISEVDKSWKPIAKIKGMKVTTDKPKA